MDTRPRLLADRYELQGILASGGMGRVWRAHDTLLNRPVAVKILRSEFTGDAAFLARFRAEAQHAAALIHPNIAAVFDYGELDDAGEHLAYLVMELVEGESLASRLAGGRRLDVATTLTVVRSTAAALAAAHAAGVVHRDIKPGNVLMARDGGVKITDFGIAWSASSVPLTQTGQVIGTAHYLSPEQAQGGKATPASDVYAVGAVAYECLTGRRPFDGENSVQIAVMHIRDTPDPLPREIPAEVRGLVERAMAKDPAERFPDGAALRDATDAVTAGRPMTAAGRTDTGTAVMSLADVAMYPGTAPTTRAAGRPPGAGRRAALRVAWGALGVLVLLAVGIGLLQRGTENAGGSPAAARTTPPTSTSPSAVHVTAADYVGRKVADVRAALIALGLQVKTVPVTSAAIPPGQVTAVAPAGALAPGSTVTVSYAVAPVVVPTPKPQAPVANTPAGGDAAKGHGHGHDHGHGHKERTGG
ncbi:MAG TPA: protein kinase [Blastococcus sp.]|nr:protein kinase [Blastococcus sp.]